MTAEEVTQKIVDWARAELADLAGGYDFVASTKTEKLPDVMVDLQTVEVVKDSPDFPFQQLQQAFVRVFRFNVSFMVDNADPGPAASQLRGFADTLYASALGDGTLGGRVDFISPFVTFDLSPPFVEYEDGTKGREMQLRLAVGELVEAE